MADTVNKDNELPSAEAMGGVSALGRWKEMTEPEGSGHDIPRIVRKENQSSTVHRGSTTEVKAGFSKEEQDRVIQAAQANLKRTISTSELRDNPNNPRVAAAQEVIHRIRKYLGNRH